VRQGKQALGLFERYLTLWVIICLFAGILIGNLFPSLSELLGTWVIPGTSVPMIVGVCLFLMIYPILVNTQFEKLREALKAPGPLFTNVFYVWTVKPLIMFVLAWFFLKMLWNLPEYAIGIIVLGCAPCTVMVMFWSMLADSSVEFCIILCAVHSVIMLVMYAPLVYFLTGLIIYVPWEPVALSVTIFLGLPLLLGVITRYTALQSKGSEWFESKLSPALSYLAMVGLFMNLVVLFSLKGYVFVQSPLLTLKIATPQIIESYLDFAVAYAVSKLLKFPYEYASVSGIVASGNHTELTIATTIATWGIASSQALAGTVGPLVEVPIMLSIAGICLKTRKYFPKNS